MWGTLAVNVNGTWRSRFGIVKGKDFHHFVSTDDRRLLRTLDLRQMVQFGPDPAAVTPEEAQRQFVVEFGDGSAMRFRCADEATRDKWLRGLASTEVFGQPLHVVADRKQGSHDRGVPLVLLKCITYLNTHGLHTENLYRIPGDSNEVKALRARFNQDDTAVDLAAGPAPLDVHVVASLVKLYLRELPEPVLPGATIVQLQSALSQPETPRLAAFRHELALLPLPNYRTLRKLVVHLAKLLEHSEETRLSANVLAALFAPALAHGAGKGHEAVSASSERAIVEVLIANAAQLFEDTSAAAKLRGIGAVLSAGELPGGDDRTVPLEVMVVHPNASGTGELVTVQAGLQTSAKEFVALLLQQLHEKQPDANFNGYALVEVLPGGERVIDDYEKVVPRLTAALPEAMGAFVYKLDEARNVALPLVPPTYLPDVQGWLWKQGVSIKSWKRRFCVLRAEGIFYYKDSTNLAPGAELGSIPFHGLAICTVLFGTQRAPAPYGFCVRRRWPRTPDEIFCRIFTAESEDDRLLWMAALRFAKNPSKYLSLMQDPHVLSGADPILPATPAANAGADEIPVDEATAAAVPTAVAAAPAAVSAAEVAATVAAAKPAYTGPLANLPGQMPLNELLADDDIMPMEEEADASDDDREPAAAAEAKDMAAVTAPAPVAPTDSAADENAKEVSVDDEDKDDDEAADREQELRELERILAEQEELRRRAEALRQKLTAKKGKGTANTAAASPAALTAANENRALAASEAAEPVAATEALMVAEPIVPSAELALAMDMLNLATGGLPAALLNAATTAVSTEATAPAVAAAMTAPTSAIPDLLLLEAAEQELYKLSQALAAEDDAALAVTAAPAAVPAEPDLPKLERFSSDDDDDDDDEAFAEAVEAAPLDSDDDDEDDGDDKPPAPAEAAPASDPATVAPAGRDWVPASDTSSGEEHEGHDSDDMEDA